MLFNLLQAAVDTTALTQAMEPAVQEKTLSLIDLATAGGWLMIVLLILSIMAIYIFGSKWWMIRKASSIDKHFSITDITPHLITTYIDENKNYLIRRLNEGFIQELRNEGNEKWATYLAARKALMEKIGRKDVVR